MSTPKDGGVTWTVFHREGDHAHLNALLVPGVGTFWTKGIKDEAGQVEVLGHAGGVAADWFDGDEILQDRARLQVTALYAGFAAEIRYGGDPKEARIDAGDDDATAAYVLEFLDGKLEGMESVAQGSPS